MLRQVLPPGAVPDFARFTSESARPGVLEGHLEAAGLREVDASWFEWETEYPDFDAWWVFNAEFGPLAALFGSLDEGQLAAARQLMREELSPCFLHCAGQAVQADWCVAQAMLRAGRGENHIPDLQPSHAGKGFAENVHPWTLPRSIS